MTLRAQVFTLISWTLLELASLRLLLTCVGVIIALTLGAEAGAALALTAADSFATVLYAAPARIAAMLIVTVTVAASVQAERDSGLLELTRARPISPATWYAGRCCAFLILAIVLAVAFGLPLMVRMPGAAAMWTAALGCELAIVASMALAIATTLRHITGTVTAVAGFYLLARVIHAIVLMSHGEVADVGHWLRPAVEAIALVMPDLHRFAATARLTGAVSATPLELLPQTLAFVVLLSAMGLIDARRREF